ncbi:hypothetical protein [Sphingomonas sp.]|uniref:hypothetical protein n=1 Tax=Sphingomonas sp. TaxID=28214 RepID=UPI003B00D5B2
MTASEYVPGAGLRWTAAAARTLLTDRDRERLPAALASAQSGMACDRRWLANRLTVLWLAAGYRKGEAQATAWLGEMLRLLAHVPTDILAAAIDQSVMRSERGFLPAAGEILKLADPALRRRQEALRKLEMLAEAPAAPLAVETPVEVCTPEQAAAILQEQGLPVTPAPRAEPASRPEATVDDYVELGLTREEAQAAVDERRRLLSRGRAKPIGSTDAVASAQAA